MGKNTKNMEVSKDFRRTGCILIKVFNVGNIMDAKSAASAALDESTAITANGGLGKEMLVADLDERADGNSSSKATLSVGFLDIGDERTFKEAVAHRLAVE